MAEPEGFRPLRSMSMSSGHAKGRNALSLGEAPEIPIRMISKGRNGGPIALIRNAVSIAEPVRERQVFSG